MAVPVFEMIMEMAQGMADEAGKEADKGEAKNWLVALSNAMAEIQGKFLENAMTNLDEMGKLDPSEKSEAGDFMTQQGEYQANMKMFGMMAEALSTTLKTIGEALSSLSRKQ